jgi:capsular polysaccharide biosynthesis protein
MYRTNGVEIIRNKYSVRRNPYWFYPTTWKYLIAKYSSLQRVRHIYKEFDCDETNYFTEAKRLVPEINKNFRTRSVKSPVSFVAVLKNGRLCEENDFVLSATYKLLQDVSFHFNAKHLRAIRKREAYRRWKSRPYQYYPETVAVLTFCSAHNYFHWMFDVLPRIELLRRSGIQIDRFAMNRQWILPFQEETLSVLGISRDKLIDIRSDLQARMLVVPSLITRYILKSHSYVRPRIIPGWTCDFLRKEFLRTSNNDSPVQSEYIYISRENSIYRKVLNEEEIINQLAAFGFSKVTLESMTVAEQVKLFSCAKVIVAPHGAGLANVVFCKPGTKIIELFSNKYMPAYYWMISNHVHLDYYYLVSKVEKSSLASSDFTVDIVQLLEIIQYAGQLRVL